MKILIGMGHPADVHFFRFFIKEVQRRGHAVFVVAREKDHTCFLLDQYGIAYYRVGRHQKTLFRKVVDYFIRWVRTYRLCRRVKPDIALGVGDFYLPQVGRVLGFPAIVITDTETAVHDLLLTFPFAFRVLTPTCYQRRLGKKQTRYNSYNELAYLGKNRFSPDPGIYEQLGIDRGKRYMVVRFTGRTAVHDMGRKGLSPAMKRRVVAEFAKYARVFVSSEPALPEDLMGYLLPVSPEKIHQVLYFADLLYGDSATMASEAACLGTPAIYVDDRGRGYTEEQEKKYGLVFNFTNGRAEQERSIAKGVEILGMSEDREQWRQKRDRMLGEKIDMTGFLVEEVLRF